MSDFIVGAIRTAHQPVLRRAVAEMAHLVHAMLRARATRRMLTDMDDRLLADIGVGRGDALVESRRPMWDLVPHRR